MARIPSRRLIERRRRRWAPALALAAVAGFLTAVAPVHFDPALQTVMSWRSRLAGPDGLWTLRLSVDTRRLGAAALLDHGRGPRDHWWLPAQLTTRGQVYDVEIVPSETADGMDTDRGWQIRLADGDRIAGMHQLSLTRARIDEDFLDWTVRRAARELGLISAPSGFASLRVNGGAGELMYWREAPSRALLARMASPAGEILVPSMGAMRGRIEHAALARYQPLFGSRGDARSLAAAAKLAALESVVSADDARFVNEVPHLVDVERVLRWHLLAENLERQTPGAHATIAASAWFFDPVTGLLSPVLDARHGRDALGQEAETLRRRLANLASFQPELRAAQLALARLQRNPAAAADADALDAVASRLARSSPLPWRWLRKRTLQQLARDVDRQWQQALTAAVPLADPAPLGTLTPVLHSADSVASAARFLARARRAGLAPTLVGDRLVVPAGEHHLRHTLILPTGMQLQIEAGATLRMGPGASLVTFRALEAIGTRDAPIRIVAAERSKAWGTIGVARANATSELAFVTVEGGSQFTFDGIEFPAQLSFNASPLWLRNSEIRSAVGGDGLSVRSTSFRVDASRFVDNEADGFDAEWTQGSVRTSVFANNGDDGLDLASSEVSIDDSWFRRMGDKALSVGEKSHAAVAGSQLVDSPIAIASKEDSRVVVRQTEIRRNGVGFAVYRRKSIFGDAVGVVSGGLFAENGRDFDVAPGSQLSLFDVARRDTDPTGVIVGHYTAPIRDFEQATD